MNALSGFDAIVGALNTNQQAFQKQFASGSELANVCRVSTDIVLTTFTNSRQWTLGGSFTAD